MRIQPRVAFLVPTVLMGLAVFASAAVAGDILISDREDEDCGEECEGDVSGDTIVDDEVISCGSTIPSNPFDPGGQSQMQHLMEGCNPSQGSSSPYEIVPLPPPANGIRVTYNGGEVTCLGYAEQSPGIQTTLITHSSDSMVAKIDKFVEDAVGSTAENPRAGVFIELNGSSIFVPIIGWTPKEFLNQAVYSALAPRYTVLDRPGYWVIIKSKWTRSYISSIKLRADDEGLTTSRVVMRPLDDGTDPDYADPNCPMFAP